MPNPTDTQASQQPLLQAGFRPPSFQSLSIRDELEKLAWMQNPRLSGRLAGRMANRARRNHDHPRKTSRNMRWQDRVLISLAAVLLAVFFLRTESAAAATPQWGLELKTANDKHTQLAINTDIQVSITGLNARVEVSQLFSNHDADWAEGIYRFPLPQGAAVDRLYIKVGERILEGEIQEKETARRIYQQARDNGQTATLVEQQRRNQFETRLANIGPGETVQITIGYLQNISYSDLSYHLRIPLTFTPRWNTPHSGGQTATVLRQIPALAKSLTPASRPPEPILTAGSLTDSHAFSLRVNLVTAVEFAAIESRYHDVDIRQITDGYRIELLDPEALADRDFELSWTPTLQAAPSASLTTFNDGESVYAQLMLAPPLTSEITSQAREIILIIDTSGSMQGGSLEQAQAALLQALDSLGPDDYFNLLQFNSSTEQLFDQSVPFTPANRYQAQDFITGLEANGGTDMAPALSSALALPEVEGLMRQVVFITDGAVGNESELLQQVANELGSSRMFTIGIGHAPNSWFMRKAAEIGRGSHIKIANLDEVEQQMSALWNRIRIPALTDICVNWGDTAEFYPEIVPDMYAGEPLWLIARMPAEPTIVSLCGEFNGQQWDLNVNGWDAASPQSGTDSLAILWARKKIEALEDRLMFGADRELTQLEITDVALEFGLLTRHTSLVAVDKTPRRGALETLAQTDVPGLLPAGSSSQLAGFPATATGWLAQLLLSAFVLLLSSSLLWFSGSHLPMVKAS